MNIKDRAAIESSCKFVEEQITPRPCDSNGISHCWRCNSIYLAKRMRELLAAQPPQDEREAIVSKTASNTEPRLVESFPIEVKIDPNANKGDIEINSFVWTCSCDEKKHAGSYCERCGRNAPTITILAASAPAQQATTTQPVAAEVTQAQYDAAWSAFGATEFEDLHRTLSIDQIRRLFKMFALVLSGKQERISRGKWSN